MSSVFCVNLTQAPPKERCLPSPEAVAAGLQAPCFLVIGHFSSGSLIDWRRSHIHTHLFLPQPLFIKQIFIEMVPFARDRKPHRGTAPIPHRGACPHAPPWSLPPVPHHGACSPPSPVYVRVLSPPPLCVSPLLCFLRQL